jgi:hypothetical protein
MAASTRQFMASVFGLDRMDFWKIKDLVSQGPRRFPGYIGRQSFAAFLTGLGINIYNIIHLAFGKKSPFFAFVPDLPSSFSAASLFVLFLVHPANEYLWV